MPGTRDHAPLVIEDFNGLWKRGDDESAPSDHFVQADNIQYFHSGFETRDGVVPYLTTDELPSIDAPKFVRMYNYVTQTGQSILALDTNGFLYHIVKPGNPYVNPILIIPAMEDFGFVAINGRAYITPFKTYTNLNGEKYQLGLQNEFLYVYKGDGNPARKAAGFGPSPINPITMFTAAAGAINSGHIEIGYHIFAVVYETDTGFQSQPGPISPFVLPAVNFDGTQNAILNNIPLNSTGDGLGNFFTDPAVVKRHIVATKAILPAALPIGNHPDYRGFDFFFIPGAVLNDITTTTLTVDFFDSDLILDASHLFDIFGEIPAGVALNTYHSRLVLVGEFGTTETLQGLPNGVTDNRSIARVSYPGEPEAIDKITGVIIAPLDGKALTQVQELRDVLFLFKNTRTYSYSDGGKDSGLTPAEWQEEVVDQGIGSSVHGIATVLDSGGSNIDFLLIVDWSGLLIFNGVYAQPELTWKIENIWRDYDRNLFNQIQIVNDSLNKHLYITTSEPNRNVLLHADYANGLNSKDIRWCRWGFSVFVYTITLIETDRLVVGTVEPDTGFLPTRF